MSSILEKYWHELRGKFDRLPVWLPGTSMRLGDVGVLEKTGWSKVTSLDAIGIAFRKDPLGAPSSFSYSSRNGAELSVNAAAHVDGQASMLTAVGTEISLRFTRGGAFVLLADDVEVQRIRDLDDIDNKVLQAYEQGAWKQNWCFVSEVAIAAHSLVVVAGEGQAEATVAVGNQAAQQTAGTGLVHGDVGLRFTLRRNLDASFATLSPSAVMWRGRYVHSPLLRSARVVERGVSRGPAGPEEETGPAVVYEVEYPGDIGLSSTGPGHAEEHPAATEETS